LCFLWQGDQFELLEEMLESGMEVLMVKVSSLGLDPTSHLGKSLPQLKDHLLSLNDQFQVHVCGEGGEYESLILDCPLFLGKRVVLDETEIEVNEEDESVGFLKITKHHISTKGEGREDDDSLDLNYPPSIIKNSYVTWVEDDFATINSEEIKEDDNEIKNENLKISTPYSYSISPKDDEQLSLPTASLQLDSMLSSFQYGLSDVCFVRLVVDDMSQFGEVNEVYKKHFPSSNPPSRACIQAHLPPNVHISIQFIFKPPDVGCEVLHVQSLSEWAPLCIGPYSQANVLGNQLILIAGQIGLVPHTMQMVTPLQQQVTQSMRNMRRVACSLGVDLQNCGLLYVYLADEYFLGNDSTDLVSDLIFEEGSLNKNEIIIEFIQCERLPKDALVEVEGIFVKEIESEIEVNFSSFSFESIDKIDPDIIQVEDHLKIVRIQTSDHNDNDLLPPHIHFSFNPLIENVRCTVCSLKSNNNDI